MTPPDNPNNKKHLGTQFWHFHLIFWVITAFIMMLSGLTQYNDYLIAVVRNVLYGALGLVCTLPLVPFFDRLRHQTTLNLLLFCLFVSYFIGAGVSLLINPVSAAQGGLILWEQPVTRWFGGSLNFSLVILVWCGFYLAFKHGLKFVGGEDEKKAAQAISSLTSVSDFPDFMALERNKKIFLLPIEQILAVQGAGDYVEICTDEGTFLKRESMSNMVEMLDPKIFQRVHRSAIVNLHCIKELEPKGKGDYTLTLKSGAEIAASRSYMKDFKARFSGVM